MKLIFNRIVVYFSLSLGLGFFLARLFFFQASMQELSIDEVQQLFAAEIPEEEEKPQILPAVQNLQQLYEQKNWSAVQKSAEQDFPQLKDKVLSPQEMCADLPDGICFYYWAGKFRQELQNKKTSMINIFFDYIQADPFDEQELRHIAQIVLPEQEFNQLYPSETKQTIDEMLFTHLKQGDWTKLPVKSGLAALTQKFPFFYHIELALILLGILCFAFYTYPVQKARSVGELAANHNLTLKCTGLVRSGVVFLWLTVLALLINQMILETWGGGELELSYKLIIYSSYLSFGLLSTLVWQSFATSQQVAIMHDLLQIKELYKTKSFAHSLSVKFRLTLITMTLTLVPLFFLFVLATTDPQAQDFITASLSQQVDSIFMLDIVPIVKMFIALFFIICFAFVGFFASRSLEKSFVRPLAELIDKMQKVKKGDFSVRVPVTNNDEIGHICGDFNDMVASLEEKQGLQDAMDKYLSKEISRTVLDDNSLGGTDLDATVLFSDIRGFTSLSEQLSPQEVIEFLNDYFSHVATAITKEGGVINKYIGDCIMALFGVTTQTPQHADHALAAALAMREKVRTYNILRSRAGKEPVRIGIGLHSGPLVAGNMGTPDRLEYTVIGDTVNVASRIESQTKELKTDILISRELKDRLSGNQGARFLLCPGIMVKGKSEPLELYKVLIPKEGESDGQQDQSPTNESNSSSEADLEIPTFDG